MEIIDENWLIDFFDRTDSELNVNRRESSTIEFKKEFDWSSKKFKSKIAKTAASFANNKGGVIFFGINNRPNKIVGVDNFDLTDNYEISTYFNEIFSPYIQFESQIHKVYGLNIGILFVYESDYKPIICCRDTIETNAGDIYFRYSAKSERIKYGDLISIMSQIRQNESKKWLSFLSKAASIGLDNIAVLNTLNGELSGKSNTFILDEYLLNQIKILDRYSLKETGAPAVKIIGEIKDIGKIIAKSKTLYEEDILNSFISDTLIVDPIEYLRAICHSSTYSLPFYYIFKHLKMGQDKAIDLIKSLKIKNFVSGKLIERINSEEELLKRVRKYKFTTSDLGKKRKEYFDKILKGDKIIFNDIYDVKAFLETLTIFERNNIPMEIIRPYLKQIFKEYYPFKKVKNTDYLFRNVLTYLDFLENGFD